MEISADRVKALRERSGAGVMDCKRALEEAGGDLDRAAEVLRERGLDQAAKRAGRETSEGLIEAYVHTGGRIGALVEVNCETDFVARTVEFQTLARDVAMQVAAMNPPSVHGEDRPSTDGHAPDGVPLMAQPFIKDTSRTVADIVAEVAAKTGEHIVVRRFVRYELGLGE
ncbi:MAG: translation elongation factor Ts [Chloroflexi bacterium]|nr:translation elongation factor Ts [Chloroflexota bacterium]